MSIATAARELLEETGHRAEQMWPVAESFANAASQTNRVWSFLAINCRPVGDTRFDPGDNIALAPVALADCLKGLHAGRLRMQRPTCWVCSPPSLFCAAATTQAWPKFAWPLPKTTFHPLQL